LLDRGSYIDNVIENLGRKGRKEESRLEQSYLRFSLEESIWFKKGQEVSEFISISLDPVISVDEYEHYITIRGALELSGEYRMVEGEENDSEWFDFSAHRFVQRVTTREDGVSELLHRFPVDITIPKNRIFNLEDVYVTVESFDYDLDENGRLLLTADISISGIDEVRQSEDFENEHEEQWFEPFEVVARKEAYQEEEETLEENRAYLAAENENVTAKVEEGQKEKVAAEATEATEREFVQEKETSIEVMHRDENKAQHTIPVEEVDLIHENEAKVSIGTVNQRESKAEKRYEYVSEEEEAVERPKPRKENALYLTKLFAKEQDQDFSRLKICIVQQGDSMDKIAERYDITVQQLLRANHLDYETQLQEGQLLYIPVPAGSRA
jgi:stage VI sporulation protein D